MRFLALVVISMLISGAARADATRDALTEIAKCADIAESSERLKCFDAAVPRARSALVAPEQQPAEKRGFLEWFGFSKPVQKPEDFGKPPPPPGPGEITEITSNVIEFAWTPKGRAVFVLDNGQVWRQLDADSTAVRDPTPGKPMKVTIETGAIGSFNMSIEGRNGIIKVTRLK